MLACRPYTGSDVLYLGQFAGAAGYNSYFAGLRAQVSGTGRCLDGAEEATRWGDGPIVCTRISTALAQMAWGFDGSHSFAIDQDESLATVSHRWADSLAVLTR
jgi:hypothetical protein